MSDHTFRDPQVAFANALSVGAMSHDDDPDNVENWMYMYSSFDHDFFKHRDTREYLNVRR